MKKLMPLMLLFANCSMNYLRTFPAFRPGDTVLNRYSHIVYIVDRPMMRKDKPFQVFYSAHNCDGFNVYWLPQNSIFLNK